MCIDNEKLCDLEEVRLINQKNGGDGRVEKRKDR